MTEQQDQARDDGPFTAQEPFPADDRQLELADSDTGTLEVFPPARTPVSEAQAMLRANVQMLDDAYRVADIVCQTQAAPQRYRGKPKEATVAIMYGAELGLPPMAAMQKVINIHGMPSVEARTMKGLLKAKGFRFRTIVKAEDEFIIHAWEPDSDKRTDPPDEVAHWTMARAIKARYVPVPSSEDSLRRPDVDDDWVTVTKTFDGRSKKSVVGNMKYITDPVGMLEAKGTADVCRAIAPEILMGLPYASEERDDWSADDGGDDEPAVRQPARARGVNRLRDRAKAAQHPDDEPQDADVVDSSDEPESGQERARGREDEQEKSAAARTEPAPASESSEPTPVVKFDGDDLVLTVEDRATGENLLGDLLDEAKIEDAADRIGVVAEIAAKAHRGVWTRIERFSAMNNSDLKAVVDRLLKQRENGKLFDYCGEALNAASLREAGLAESGS